MTVRTYPEYRESGVGWVGSLPKTWWLQRVLEAVNLINGFPFDSMLFAPEGGIPLIRIRDLNQYQTDVYYTGSTLTAVEVTNHDLLIGMDGDFNVGRWKGAEVALLNQRVCCLRGSSNAVRWMEYALLIPLKLINDLTYSTTVKHLSSGQVKSIRVPTPPTEDERGRILEFLDRETGKIDALVAEQERLIALLKEKRQAVISHAVTKGLNPDAPMKDSGVPWLGEVPAHWKVKPLKFVATVQSGVAKGRDLTNVETIEVPYLRVANVQDGYLNLDDVSMMSIGSDELARYLLRKGDILMNEGGDFDKLGRGQVWDAQIDPCIHQNHVFAVRPHSANARWIALITSADCGRFFFMSRAKQSTNLASISSTNLMELPVSCPPTTECEEILLRTAVTLNALTQLNNEATRAITLLRERRAALISAAVTGKIDVRDTVPTTQNAA